MAEEEAAYEDDFVDTGDDEKDEEEPSEHASREHRPGEEDFASTTVEDSSVVGESGGGEPMTDDVLLLALSDGVSPVGGEGESQSGHPVGGAEKEEENESAETWEGSSPPIAPPPASPPAPHRPRSRPLSAPVGGRQFPIRVRRPTPPPPRPPITPKEKLHVEGLQWRQKNFGGEYIEDEEDIALLLRYHRHQLDEKWGSVREAAIPPRHASRRSTTPSSPTQYERGEARRKAWREKMDRWEAEKAQWRVRRRAAAPPPNDATLSEQRRTAWKARLEAWEKEKSLWHPADPSRPPPPSARNPRHPMGTPFAQWRVTVDEKKRQEGRVRRWQEERRTLERIERRKQCTTSFLRWCNMHHRPGSQPGSRPRARSPWKNSAEGDSALVHTGTDYAL